MSQQIVLITGCSKGGIGYALAVQFAKEGHKVIATARRIEALEGLEEFGCQKEALDIADPTSIEALMKKINDTTGTIDILVNNAGAPAVGALLDIDMEVATQCINTNLFGTLAMCKAVGPSMIKRGKGKIVNVGSIMAYAGTPWAGIYCASKAALHSMTDSLRLELQPFGVQVIVVAPGAITSNFGTAGAKLVKVPEDSFYASVTNYIVARAGMSQDSSTPTDVFATHVTRKVLSSNPPHYITYGSKSTIFWFLYYAPSYIRDMIFYKRFGLDLVNK